MNVREKLVELLKKADKEALSAAEMGKPYNETEVLGRMADNLIAHGVTVQEWISVNDERKPKEGEDVLVAVFDGYDTYTDMDCLMRDGKWCFETENYKVTHWMEKPKPPKGE